MNETSTLGRIGSGLRKLLPQRFRTDIPIVPVVRLSGVIGVSSPLKPGLTLASSAKCLKGVHTRNARRGPLNQFPGGSAVQSHLIFQRVRALAEENEVPVIAFVEDVAASGGYMIACAADEIICDAASIVGSIGVVGGAFGFDKLIEKIGIERRLYTSGDRKVMLDPFLPEKPEDVERLKGIQKEIHDGFIALVQVCRGAKLDGRERPVFRRVLTGIAGANWAWWTPSANCAVFLRARYGDKVKTC